MKSFKIKKIALTALFTAVIAASAWISLPTPFGVNLSFSLFGVCVTAFCLGLKSAVAATTVYIALGAIGIPVFSLFSGGVAVLVGASGGFIWGYLIIAAICGIIKNCQKKSIKYLFIIISVLICHIMGIIQYHFVTGNNLVVSFLSVSLPFLFKDILLAFLADFISKKIKI